MTRFVHIGSIVSIIANFCAVGLLCEMKYAQNEFVIDKKYDETLRNKIAAFQEETHTRKSLQLTFVTTYGVKQNAYSGHVQKEVVLEDLFQ